MRWTLAIAILMAILWTIPTFGLLITSIRPQASIQSSGWWTWFTNPESKFNLESNFNELIGRHASYRQEILRFAGRNAPAAGDVAELARQIQHLDQSHEEILEEFSWIARADNRCQIDPGSVPREEAIRRAEKWARGKR